MFLTRPLEAAIARATGESVATIAEHGFVLLTPVPQEREPLTVDWDEVDARQRVIFPVGVPRAVAAQNSLTMMPK